MASNNSPPPQPPLPSTPSRLSSETVKKAVNALLKWRNAKSKTEKPQLLSQDDYIYLILTLKKIPPKGRTNPYKIPLPHSIHSPDSTEVCLILDDRPKSKLTSEAAKKKIQSESIPISKVLKLSKLKSDYRPFEAKRKLCDSYEMFLADKRVIPLLPKLLGKHFYKKRKIPVPVNLTHKNWKEQVEKACGSALLYLRTGTCSVVRVGKDSMEGGEIVDNAVAAINGVVEILAKKWGSVRSFHLKFSESLALPVYQAMPDAKLRIESGKEREKEGEKEGEVGSERKKDVKLGKKKGVKKGRIHEVRYMDENVDDLLEEDQLASDDENVDVNEGVERENYELGDVEVEGKKRKKGDLVKKGLKKLAKVEKVDGVKQKKDDELSGEGKEESGGKKEKKNSGLGKLKNEEMKVKAKKKKKNQAAE